jgi:DNA-binding response OmpR family regulator
MSGQLGPGDEVMGLQIDGYLHKPFRIEEFLATIRAFGDGPVS